MAYRDPKKALRARLDARQEDVLARRRRITDVLFRQLPSALAERLSQTEQALQAGARDDSEEALRQREQQLELYAASVDEVYRLVPALDERLQRLKRGYPSRAVPPGYSYPDVYAKRVELLRANVHEQLQALNPKVKLFDNAAEYFNVRERPLLVDAQLRVRGVPVTLAVHALALPTGDNQQTYTNIRHFGYWARCYVPVGVPPLEIHPQGVTDAMLQWVGLQKDTVTGDELFDRAFRILQPADPGVNQLLSDGVRRALRVMGESTVRFTQLNIPSLRIFGGEAQLRWIEDRADGRGIVTALELLKLLRETPPPLLLAAQQPLT